MKIAIGFCICLFLVMSFMMHYRFREVKDDLAARTITRVVKLGESVHSRKWKYEIEGSVYRTQENDPNEILFRGVNQDGMHKNPVFSLDSNDGPSELCFKKDLIVPQTLIRESGKGRLLKLVTLKIRLEAFNEATSEGTFSILVIDVTPKDEPELEVSHMVPTPAPVPGTFRHL